MKTSLLRSCYFEEKALCDEQNNGFVRDQETASGILFYRRPQPVPGSETLGKERFKNNQCEKRVEAFLRSRSSRASHFRVLFLTFVPSLQYESLELATSNVVSDGRGLKPAVFRLWIHLIYPYGPIFLKNFSASYTSPLGVC